MARVIFQYENTSSLVGEGEDTRPVRLGYRDRDLYLEMFSNIVEDLGLQDQVDPMTREYMLCMRSATTEWPSDVLHPRVELFFLERMDHRHGVAGYLVISFDTSPADCQHAFFGILIELNSPRDLDAVRRYAVCGEYQGFVQRMREARGGSLPG